MEKPTSACCGVKIITHIEKHQYDWDEEEYEWKEDKCSGCGERIHYALMDSGWAKWEACGVFEDYNSELWFFWESVRVWDLVIEKISPSEESSKYYIGQIKSIVDTMGIRYKTQDTDLIPISSHRSFLDSYKNKTKNPEIVNLFSFKSES